jgi:hypothetical protein
MEIEMSEVLKSFILGQLRDGDISVQEATTRLRMIGFKNEDVENMLANVSRAPVCGELEDMA